ncbi:hypothetical protein E2C01_089178 [Portunus trituberculatus]|uniref:Uncharacterized protein n=1 Tax=Portunus trituberculatus TaxID=210409 RepID=A0A5B7JLI6_PORTR|nr:hypothetical protein [Portunus trituberculatus]
MQEAFLLVMAQRNGHYRWKQLVVQHLQDAQVLTQGDPKPHSIYEQVFNGNVVAGPLADET